MAAASLVLGICSLVFPFIGLGWVSTLLGIIGIILGAIGRNNPDKQGMATAGIVMSIISVAIGLLSWFACASCLGGISGLLG
ncbi:MAG: DUF4190 domain-containing protein [Clostridia bacterium]|nr:DUF4190 domain-containing protein [Clostridia bacterium]